ncbi:BTB/POZ protein [Rhizophagus clarus]|uniref:BTB/POZ protein n=1 Tax=Rhizophagus clarus TaxID=94130 RepID=A0A8H3L279_9GLOM|nr:BTB/POZ protein [Rhizophagus clarus]
MVLQRDDLNMEEIDIWESILRWLFVHYLKIDKDHSIWSSEDLTSWIDNKNNDYTQQNMPYTFDSAQFHQLCDNKGATISLARIKDSKQIVGGYNPLSWNSNGSYMNTSESFLFYITDIRNLSSAK